MEQENDKSLFGLSIEAQSRSFLTETAKWGKFLAIIGFIACVFIVLAGIAVATQADELNRSFRRYGDSNPMFEMGPAVIVIYIVMVVRNERLSSRSRPRWMKPNDHSQTASY